jgi:hypothetical protein
MGASDPGGFIFQKKIRPPAAGAWRRFSTARPRFRNHPFLDLKRPLIIFGMAIENRRHIPKDKGIKIQREKSALPTDQQHPAREHR